MKICLDSLLKPLEWLTLGLAMLWSVYPVCAHSKPVAYYDGQVEPRISENFGFAQYCCWLPETPCTIRGVLCVVLHPHGNTGVKFADPKPWIELAGRYQCALLSLSFVNAADRTKNWSYAFEGSGRALVTALDEVAASSGAAELSKARVVIAGICEAGQFAYEFSAYAPDRAAAFMTMGGSMHQVPLAWRAANVPGLLVAAAERDHPASDNIYSLYVEGKKFYAPWELSVEWIKDYDQGHSSALVEKFLHLALASIQRTPLTTSSTAPHSAAKTLVQKVQPNAWIAEASPQCVEDRSIDWLYLRETTEVRCFADLNLSSSALSFVSVPLPALGHAETDRIDLGAIHLRTGGSEQISTAFMVYAEGSSAVDGVAVASNQVGFSWQEVHLAVGEWRLQCNLDLSSLPSGAFTVPIPVRFLSSNKKEPGGLIIMVSGRIFRDVTPDAPAINFGRINTNDQHACIKLKSASGASIKILGVESSLPNEAKANVTVTADGSVGVDCSIIPSVSLPKEFSGYYLLRVKSDREQVVKILFFGENS